jgi:uncharacterized phage-associated protein
MELPNPNKNVQIINFFARKGGGKVGYMKLLKLVYLTDKFMLRKYGRMLSNDRYYALPHGPIPQTIKDIAQGIVYEKTSQTENPAFPVSARYCLKYLKHSSGDKWGIESLREVDEDYFSKAELEAMNAVYGMFGGYSTWKLRDLTHEFYEWKRHEIDRVNASAPMRIVDFFSDIEGKNFEAFFNADKKDVEEKKSFYMRKREKA